MFCHLAHVGIHRVACATHSSVRRRKPTNFALIEAVSASKIPSAFIADFHGRKLINIFDHRHPHGYWKTTERFCNQGIFLMRLVGSRFSQDRIVTAFVKAYDKPFLLNLDRAVGTENAIRQELGQDVSVSMNSNPTLLRQFVQ